MKNLNEKVVGYIAVVLLFILIIANIFVSYFLLFNRESKEPKIDEQICNITVENFKDRKIFIIEPKEDNNIKRNIFYFHGGSYVAEATSKHWEFLQKLAINSNARIYMPDYPLTPKNNYKDVFNMVEPFYLEYIKKIDINNLIIMGDSAGGGLALGLMEKISNENYPIPSKIILISPWLDVRLNNPEIDEVQKKDKMLNKNNLQIVGNHYSGNEKVDNYLINPIDGDLSKLNNITIFTGTNDILNPDVHKLQEIAKEQGITISIKEYEGASHIWIIENTTCKELADKGYDDLLDIVNK